MKTNNKRQPSQPYFSKKEVQAMQILGGIGVLIAAIWFPKHKIISGFIGAGLGLTTAKLN